MNFPLPGPVAQALDRLNDAGYAAYAVGGCVRDRVLGLTPHDYDICTSARPGQMQQVFAGERIIETGIRHGTLTVLLSGMPLEITTFRVDGAYLDGRHPQQVQFTGRVEDDLARRDFTINAMAYHPAEGLIDPFGGQADCRAGIIRCVGEPLRRFEEDALRILRALRFSARLGFAIAPETEQAIFLLHERLSCISHERIAAELTGLLVAPHASSLLAQFSPVIFFLLPPLDQPAWDRTLATLPLLPAQLPLRLAGLMQGCDTDTARMMLHMLRLPNQLTDDVAGLIAWQYEPLAREKMQWLLMKLGPEQARRLVIFQEALQKAAGDASAQDRAQELLHRLDMLEAENVCCSLRQLQLSGRELAALGYQGPAIGSMLHLLLEQVTLGQLPNDHAVLLAAARTHAP